MEAKRKEKKTILTNHKGTIIFKNEKHYRAYNYITSERRESLETIKPEKEKLDKLSILESLIEKNITPDSTM
jgi:K+/H+ antiporter YhaU regulatory subunit KhtT